MHQRVNRTAPTSRGSGPCRGPARACLGLAATCLGLLLACPAGVAAAAGTARAVDAAGGGERAGAAAAAGMVLIHGHIITVDAQDSIAQALAVRDGRIIAIGTDRDILRLAGPATRRIDLNGRTATPGLIDSHAHIAEAGVDELYHVHLSDVTSIAEAVRRVRRESRP